MKVLSSIHNVVASVFVSLLGEDHVLDQRRCFFCIFVGRMSHWIHEDRVFHLRSSLWRELTQVVCSIHNVVASLFLLGKHHIEYTTVMCSSATH